MNGSATPVSELGLGYPDISLTVVKDRAHLKYLRGSICPKDPDSQLSSVIEFYCDPSAGKVQQKQSTNISRINNFPLFIKGTSNPARNTTRLPLCI